MLNSITNFPGNALEWLSNWYTGCDPYDLVCNATSGKYHTDPALLEHIKYFTPYLGMGGSTALVGSLTAYGLYRRYYKPTSGSTPTQPNEYEQLRIKIQETLGDAALVLFDHIEENINEAVDTAINNYRNTYPAVFALLSIEKKAALRKATIKKEIDTTVSKLQEHREQFSELARTANLTPGDQFLNSLERTYKNSAATGAATFGEAKATAHIPAPDLHKQVKELLYPTQQQKKAIKILSPKF